MSRGWGEDASWTSHPDPRDARRHPCSSPDDAWGRTESNPIPEIHAHEKRLGEDAFHPDPVTHGVTSTAFNPMSRGWGEDTSWTSHPDPRDARCHPCSSPDDAWGRTESNPIPEIHAHEKRLGEDTSWTSPSCSRDARCHLYSFQSHEKRLGGRHALGEPS